MITFAWVRKQRDGRAEENVNLFNTNKSNYKKSIGRQKSLGQYMVCNVLSMGGAEISDSLYQLISIHIKDSHKHFADIE